MKMKRLLAYVIVCLAACTALSVPAFANESDSADNSNKILFTEELAMKEAGSFCKSMEPDVALSATYPVKLYNTSNQAIGYIINYVNNNEDPHGYVIFDNTHESLIAEYSFENGSKSPYDTALARIPSNSPSTLSQSKTKAVKTSSFVYAALDTQTGYAINSFGDDSTTELSTFDAYSTPSTSSWDDIFIMALGSGSSEYTIVTQTNINQFISIDESWVERASGRYACSVSAMLNAAAYYLEESFNWGNIGTEYLTLWDLSDTFVDYVGSNGITYGLANSGKLGSSLQSYCAAKGVSLSYSESNSPSYSQFVNTIGRGDVAIFSCGIIRSDLGKRVGHSMTVEGCATLKRGTISDNIYTLLVSDGWYGNGRYLNFYYTAYTDTYGTFYARS